MTISFKSIVKDVKRNLSYIGKRSYTKEGVNIFADITTSSAEDPIFLQHINSSMHNVEAALQQFIREWDYGQDDVEIGIVNTRNTVDFDERVERFIRSFLVDCTLADYLSMTHAPLSEKYRVDSVNTMTNLVNFVFFKRQPDATAYSYADVSATVNPDDL